jgi:hypothetical protein
MKHRAMLLCAFLLGCFAIATLLLAPIWEERKADHLRTDAHERIPVGSTRQQVEEWFQSHGISYAPVGKVGEARVGYFAQVPDHIGLDGASTLVNVTFDKQDRVSSITISRFVKGW